MTTWRAVPLVQLSVPPAGFDEIASVTTVELSVVTTWPSVFSTATTGCWLQTAPVAPPPGWVTKTSCCVEPTRNEALVAAVQTGELVAARV